jgi:hypothetical protein
MLYTPVLVSINVQSRRQSDEVLDSPHNLAMSQSPRCREQHSAAEMHHLAQGQRQMLINKHLTGLVFTEQYCITRRHTIHHPVRSIALVFWPWKPHEHGFFPCITSSYPGQRQHPRSDIGVCIVTLHHLVIWDHVLVCDLFPRASHLSHLLVNTPSVESSRGERSRICSAGCCLT